MKKKKVVIQFMEAGHGHIVTAEAIAECLEKKYSDKLEIESRVGVGTKVPMEYKI